MQFLQRANHQCTHISLSNVLNDVSCQLFMLMPVALRRPPPNYTHTHARRAHTIDIQFHNIYILLLHTTERQTAVCTLLLVLLWSMTCGVNQTLRSRNNWNNKNRITCDRKWFCHFLINVPFNFIVLSANNFWIYELDKRRAHRCHRLPLYPCEDRRNNMQFVHTHNAFE